MNHQRSPLTRVSRRRPCPECRTSNHACMIRDDGSAAVCLKVASDKPVSWGLGGWWHFYDAPRTTPYATIMRVAAPIVETPCAFIEARDAVYSKLISSLTLRPEHRRALHARGLSDAAISVAGYASTPTEMESLRVVESLNDCDLRGVPGFYRTRDGWRMVSLASGLLIPIRDARCRAQALQVRPDVAHGAKYFWLSSKEREAGASPGAPVHYAKPHLLRDASEIIITEGALKSEVISHLSGVPVIGVAGVSTFGADFGAHLRESFPSLRRAVIAYDRDLLENANVKQALLRLIAQLETARFRVAVRMWKPPAKGYDDYLLEQVLRAREVAA